MLLPSQQEYIPDLYTHFLNVGLEAHMYASQWFLTLFTAKFPLYMVFHIIDLLLCEVGAVLSLLHNYIYLDHVFDVFSIYLLLCRKL